MAVKRLASAILGVIALAPSVSLAQADDAAPGSSGAAPTAATRSAAVGSPGAGSGGDAVPANAARPSTGPSPVAHHGKGAASAVPGFETMGDGSTRLFVELSKPVAYDTKVAGSTITYVLKGARAGRRNNTNPLVTVHFNTPVTSARLVPHGHDLWFVLQLRAKVQPAVTIDAAKDGTAILRVDLPNGDYLPAQTAPATDGAPAAASGSSHSP